MGAWRQGMTIAAVDGSHCTECTVPEIAAVTGHEIERTAKILEIYLPRDSKAAANAVAKLEEWRNRSVRSRKDEFGS